MTTAVHAGVHLEIQCSSCPEKVILGYFRGHVGEHGLEVDFADVSAQYAAIGWLIMPPPTLAQAPFTGGNGEWVFETRDLCPACATQVLP